MLGMHRLIYKGRINSPREGTEDLGLLNINW